MIEQIKAHPMTCAILVLYLANFLWYFANRKWGLGLYWVAAASITICATWLRGWEG